MAGPAQRLWTAQNAVRPLEAVGREGRVRAHDAGPAVADAQSKTIMIDATYLQAHRTAFSVREKKRTSGA
ncbi:hypothetical protein HMP09_2770 [Sphingomonas sp. HMP9]|nr:hypothetical protein HMP09_2770 [Sphingomonas sp. HMP9]